MQRLSKTRRDSNPLVMHIKNQQPVLPFPVLDQENALQQINGEKTDHKKIPIVLRNYQSGWPLLQLSLLSPVVGKEGYYELALGGNGNCQHFYVAAFALAQLLARIPGRISITDSDGNIINDPKYFNFDNIRRFYNDYSFKHESLNISISQKATPLATWFSGKTIDMGGAIAEQNMLKALLLEPMLFAMDKLSDTIDTFARGHNYIYSAAEITRKLNSQVAVFHEGQIFIDLGAFLDGCEVDEDFKNYFAAFFKVDAFNALQKLQPDFLPHSLSSVKQLEKEYAEQMERLLQLELDKNAIINFLSELRTHQQFITAQERKRNNLTPTTQHLLKHAKELHQAILQEVKIGSVMNAEALRTLVDTMQLMRQAIKEYECKQTVTVETIDRLHSNYRALSERSTAKIVLGCVLASVGVLLAAVAVGAFFATSGATFPLSAPLLALGTLLTIKGLSAGLALGGCLTVLGLSIAIESRPFANRIIQPAHAFFKAGKKSSSVNEEEEIPLFIPTKNNP